MPCGFTYKINKGGNGNIKYYITVNVLGGNGDYVPVTVIADSVTGDSRLYWMEDEELKFGTMEDLYCSYIANKNEKEFKVQSVRPTTKKLTANSAKPFFAKIKDVSYHGIKPVSKITLRNGKTVKVTKDHCIFGDEKGSYQRELKAKSFDELKTVLSVDNYNIETCKQIPIDNDTLIFMGLWIADGSYYRINDNKLAGVRISTGNELNIVKWLEEFSNTINNGNGSCLKYSSSRLGDVSIFRKSFGEYIMSILGNVDSYTKRVPKEIFTATEEQITAFLKGYFSGDGSIHICNNNPSCESFKYGSYYCVDCCSVNRPLLEDISILLDRIGIKHNISSPQKPGKLGFKNGQLQYKLIIHTAPAVKKFIEKIGLIKKFEYKEREEYSRDKMLRPVSLRQIRNIEFIGPEPVYDISVEGTENFVCNGILCHNSGNDITLLTQNTAHQLGLHPSLGVLLEVSGIRENMISRFKKITTYIQIGNFTPVLAEIGFAIDGNSLQENLLGNKDILSSGKFKFIYSADKLTVVSTQGNCSNFYNNNSGSGISFI